MATADFTRPLTPSGNLRRRRAMDRFMRYGCTFAAVIAVALLVLVVEAIVQRGASAVSFDFLFKDPPISPFAPGGGVFNAIVGTALIVALGTVIALPLGMLVALYLSEFATPRVAGPVRLALDLLYGLPSIVVAIFVYGLIVVGSGESGLAVSIALAIIMLPLIARTTGESLALVPQELRDASQALGVSRWRTTVGIVIPSALGGILTGLVLAVARAAGETAPVLLLSAVFNPSVTTLNIFGQAVPSLPYEIFNLSESGGTANIAKSWGCALILVLFVLVANFAARVLHARSRRMMSR